MNLLLRQTALRLGRIVARGCEVRRRPRLLLTECEQRSGEAGRWGEMLLAVRRVRGGRRGQGPKAEDEVEGDRKLDGSEHGVLVDVAHGPDGVDDRRRETALEEDRHEGRLREEAAESELAAGDRRAYPVREGS
jgi:hypothetical protein